MYGSLEAAPSSKKQQRKHPEMTGDLDQSQDQSQPVRGGSGGGRMLNSGARGLPASSPRTGRNHKTVRVYDCRSEHTSGAGEPLETSGLDFNFFLRRLYQKFAIRSQETFVLTTTDRTVLDFDKFEELQDGSTLLLLRNENQALPAATEEHIKFTPHYKTITGSGLYEYYTSEGNSALPYALAELIDNSISATAKNTGARTIEIRMLFDETLGKPAVIVLDNGCGMTSKQLRNWAVYRLSKFSRTGSKLSDDEAYVRPQHVSRCLNSDISYFGVGGKQAVFFIGNSTRMISKPRGSLDVHELCLSEDEFERKESNQEEIYRSTIKNRRPGDRSHVKKNEERFLHSLIAEEVRKESFTAVVITGVKPQHIAFLKDSFAVWTRQLAHTYHYYIHGAGGNDMNRSTGSDHVPNIDIQITLREKPPRCPRALSLREVDNDMQTLYINAAADTFEFNAFTPQDGGTVEGVIRYHPFLYDRETYPKDVSHASGEDEDDDNESAAPYPTRSPVFDCFWNGRLIPYTRVSELDWCAWTKDPKVPVECYSRFSGALFADDRFEVTTNKLTFIDLEQKLRSKDTIFTRVVNGQKQRCNIQREFTQWLQNCHKMWDKQVKFLDYKGTIRRTDVPTKKMQHPWATFASIERDGVRRTAGQLVKSQKTQPILYGTVVKFLLFGEYDRDVFATGGEVEVALEPRALHDKTKIIPISKIDKNATEDFIRKMIENDTLKLPAELQVEWPDGNYWPQNAVCPAGTPLGPLKIQILNKKGEVLPKMSSVGQGTTRKLSVALKVVYHTPKGDQEVSCHVASHPSKSAFFFKKETLTQLGKYTLSVNTMTGENNATVFGGEPLPRYVLKFTIKEGPAQSFLVGKVTYGPQVGVPFDIPLVLKDGYDHPATPPPDVKPELQCSGADISYETVDSSKTTFTIKNVRARGKILQSKTLDVKVILPGLKNDTQTFKINLLPGKPHFLHVTPEGDPVTVQNGESVTFNVEVHDEAGNITAGPKQMVQCQLPRPQSHDLEPAAAPAVQGLPPSSTNCSNTGAGQLVTKPIHMKIIKGEPQTLKVRFEMPDQKNVAPVLKELKVLPSTRVSSMELYSQADGNLVLRNNERIEWLAGGLLQNLFYKLYDEAGREVPLTADVASRIKVNWTADVNLEDLVQGKLPDAQVPTQVQDERYFQVSYQDQSVSVSFHIVPRPDEPTQLKATLLQKTMKLGEALPGDISLELVDQYNNLTKTLTSTCVNHMDVEAEGLDKSAVTFEWQESSRSVLVKGVRFQSGTPGSREISVTYRTYVECVIVTVTPGVPAQLKLLSGPETPVQILNGHGIITPFVIQLCDKWGNLSPDQRVVVELRSSPATLKVTAPVTSQPVSSDGKVCFTVNSVSGPKGYYQLEFKGSFNNKPIHGPSVDLIVIPDPNKPVGLSVKYDTSAVFPAGGKFPVFSVTVVSDEGRPMTSFNPAAVSMLLWKGLSSGTPPETATELKCSKPMPNETNNGFRFRDKDIPEHVGKYTVRFSLRADQVLYSDPITVNVVANQPVKLGPDAQPPTPVVGYSKAIANRTLVESLTLRIMDSYGNPAGLDLDGKVVISMQSSGGVGAESLPLFEGRTSSRQINLVEGKAHISRLTIMENSPGENGSSYVLLFKPEVPMVSLAPFELPVHFYNDADNQRRMLELTKKKDELTKFVAAHEERHQTSVQLLHMLTNLYQDASRKEGDQRKELIKKNVIIPSAVSVQDIDRLLEEKAAEADRIWNMSRRVCSIQDRFKGQPDVLGMVGHLAFVQDDDAARVISWHIRGDMDCVITRTTEAARRIFDNTQGRQQVMPLDSVCVHPGNRPLPHIRHGRPLFDPPGNPVYARELLIYPADLQSDCDIVFKNFLGETILIDDLDSANIYRRAVVQRQIQCPTILTRQGDRVSSRGKFGGAQNKAPPMDQLQVFGAPCPQSYYSLMEQQEMLRQYRGALLKRDAAARDREDCFNSMNSPEMRKNQQEVEERKKRLDEIKRQLLSSPRPGKRGPEAAGEPSSSITKKPRQRDT